MALDARRTIFTHNNQSKIRGCNGGGTGEEIQGGGGCGGRGIQLFLGRLSWKGVKT